MSDGPLVSVIIPTHNRMSSLRQNLCAMGKQSYPFQRIEVLVVADGCNDGTVEMLRSCPTPFPLRVIEQTRQGPAVARNRGAAGAKGALLVFLDDDVEPAPGLIAEHVRAHRGKMNHVVIGYCPPHSPAKGYLSAALWFWWETKFHSMRRKGHRFRYSDLVSGNISLGAGLFTRVGGFDSSFHCREDYELGERLLKAGATFSFAADAVGCHHESMDLERSSERKYYEGKADVLLGRRHPELRPTLLLSIVEMNSPLHARVLRSLAFNWPTISRVLMAWIQASLRYLEALRMRFLWRRALDGLRAYHYWRGVTEELGSLREFADYLREREMPAERQDNEMELDLREGLVKLERHLDEARPAAALIHYGPQFVGRIPPEPGAERLRGEHLRAILATRLAGPLLRVLAQEGQLDLPLEKDRLVATLRRALKSR